MNKINNICGWDYFYIYLSGALDQARDSGAEWRDEWTKKLVELGFKQRQIFNPCRKPLEGAPFNLDNEGKIIGQFRKEKKYEELCQVVKQIAHIDLRLVDLSSLVLVNFPRKTKEDFKEIVDKFQDSIDNCLTCYNEYAENPRDPKKQAEEAFYELLTAAMIQIPTYGTCHEIVEARRQHKPVFIVWEGGKQNCSGWLMWLVGQKNVFSTFDEMAVKLKAIIEGQEAYDADDWLLLNLDKSTN